MKMKSARRVRSAEILPVDNFKYRQVLLKVMESKWSCKLKTCNSHLYTFSDNLFLRGVNDKFIHECE